MNKSTAVLVCLCLALASCSKRYHPDLSAYTFKSVDGKPDYANLDYWAAHPYKKDPSDSLPKALRKDFQPDSSADVFFIYPTSYSDTGYKLGPNAPIDDPEINSKTDYSSILYQASIFNAAGRLFLPGTGRPITGTIFQPIVYPPLRRLSLPMKM